MLRAFVLGIVQGLTEFLPISSSAHLSIVPKLLGYKTPELSFEVLLHFGTLSAVLAYFWRDLWEFVLCLVAPAQLGQAHARARRRLLALLVLGSIPAAAIGFVLQDWAERQASQPLRAAIFLVATTSLLLAAELYDASRGRRAPTRAAVAAGRGAGGHPGTEVEGEAPAGLDPEGRAAAPAEAELERLPTGKAFGIGVAQALALVPGVSRSGATISTGLLLGVSREAAARFSFLLSIPAILGAGVLKLDELGQGAESTPELLVGFLAAAISGFLAVSLLIRLLRTRTLWPFIWYRLAAGALFIVLLSTVRA